MMNNPQQTIGLVLAIAVLLVLTLLVGTFFIGSLGVSAPREIGCTADAMICPDGSAVGRQGPKCEFAACPGSSSPAQPAGVVCTKEAKLCPDGTAVGRIAPMCEFAPCPTPAQLR